MCRMEAPFSTSDTILARLTGAANKWRGGRIFVGMSSSSSSTCASRAGTSGQHPDADSLDEEDSLDQGDELRYLDPSGWMRVYCAYFQITFLDLTSSLNQNGILIRCHLSKSNILDQWFLFLRTKSSRDYGPARSRFIARLRKSRFILGGLFYLIVHYGMLHQKTLWSLSNRSYVLHLLLKKRRLRQGKSDPVRVTMADNFYGQNTNISTYAKK
jgi:hypothetical protein